MSNLATKWPITLEKNPEDADTVFHVSQDDSKTTDFCCYSPPSKFAVIITRPQPGSKIDRAIAAYRGQADETPLDGFRCTGHGPFWQFLCTLYWKQIVTLTGGSNKSNVMILRGIDELKEHIIKSEATDRTALTAFMSRVTETADIYLALNNEENQVHWLQALTAIWSDRYLCHHSGSPSGLPVREDQTIAVDIVAFITFLVATNGRAELFISLNAKLVAYPGFFRALRNLHQLLSSGERLVLQNRELFIDARTSAPLHMDPASVCQYVEYRSALSALSVNPMQFARMTTTLGAPAAEILLSASKDYGTTIWSDSAAQRAYAQELGIPTVNTCDLLRAMHGQGLITTTEYMRYRLRLFSFGYTGAEFGGNDVADLLLPLFSPNGEAALNDLFRGLSVASVVYNPVVDFVALLTLRVSLSAHPSADRRLDQLFKCIRALALRWNDRDLMADVVARFNDSTIPGAIRQKLIHYLSKSRQS